MNGKGCAFESTMSLECFHGVRGAARKKPTGCGEQRRHDDLIASHEKNQEPLHQGALKSRSVRSLPVASSLSREAKDAE
jgi:hypothetical protein